MGRKSISSRGASVDYRDSYYRRLHKMRGYDVQMASMKLTPSALAGYDAVVISTDHSNYDYSEIVRSSRLVIDTHNASWLVKEHR